VPSTARNRHLSADAVTSALVEDGERLTSVIDGAKTRSLGGAALFISGIPVALLNGVVTARTSATAAEVAELLKEVEEMDLPYSVQIRPDCRIEIAEFVRSRGMVEDESMPLMAMTHNVDSIRLAARHPELSVRMLEPSEAGLHHTIGAEGFEEDVAIFQRFVPSALLAVPGVHAYVGIVDGVPVTTAIGSTYGAYVGIFNVATPARHRGRGYGAAITARAVVDGFESGASIAYLQSSAMGLKVYERLGFRTLETWSVWLTPASAPSRS
jgi:N-acetylglutamate synthase